MLPSGKIKSLEKFKNKQRSNKYQFELYLNTGKKNSIGKSSNVVLNLSIIKIGWFVPGIKMY